MDTMQRLQKYRSRDDCGNYVDNSDQAKLHLSPVTILCVILILLVSTGPHAHIFWGGLQIMTRKIIGNKLLFDLLVLKIWEVNIFKAEGVIVLDLDEHSLPKV